VSLLGVYYSGGASHASRCVVHCLEYGPAVRTAADRYNWTTPELVMDWDHGLGWVMTSVVGEKFLISINQSINQSINAFISGTSP